VDWARRTRWAAADVTNNLVETLGGRPTPGVGFGTGLERLQKALAAQGVEIPTSTKSLIWLVSLGEAARDANLKLIQQLRAAGFPPTWIRRAEAPNPSQARRPREGRRLPDTGDSELSSNTSC